MKKLFCILFLSLFLLHSHAQTTDTKIYNPSANAENDISALVKLARIEHKHVLLRQAETGAAGVSSSIVLHMPTVR